MPFATATILAGAAIAGVATSAVGVLKQTQAAKKQQEAAIVQSQGAMLQAQGAREQAQASQKIAGFEMDIEAQKRAAMELDANRKNLEILRNAQRARAMGLTTATSQGANKGSGLQGGYGQVSGQTTDNLLGVSQNLDIGRNIFDINALISEQKMAIAKSGELIAQGGGITSQGAGMASAAGGQMAIGQGLSSLGGSILQALPAFGTLSLRSAPTAVSGTTYSKYG